MVYRGDAIERIFEGVSEWARTDGRAIAEETGRNAREGLGRAGRILQDEVAPEADQLLRLLGAKSYQALIDVTGNRGRADLLGTTREGSEVPLSVVQEIARSSDAAGGLETQNAEYDRLNDWVNNYSETAPADFAAARLRGDERANAERDARRRRPGIPGEPADAVTRLLGDPSDVAGHEPEPAFEVTTPDGRSFTYSEEDMANATAQRFGGEVKPIGSGAKGRAPNPKLVSRIYRQSGERVEPLLGAITDATTRRQRIQVGDRAVNVSFRPGVIETADGGEQSVRKVGWHFDDWETPEDITPREALEAFRRVGEIVEQDARRHGSQRYAFEALTPAHQRIYDGMLSRALEGSGYKVGEEGRFTVLEREMREGSPLSLALAVATGAGGAVLAAEPAQADRTGPARVLVRGYRGDLRVPQWVKETFGRNIQPGEFWASNRRVAETYRGLGAATSPPGATQSRLGATDPVGTALGTIRSANLDMKNPLVVEGGSQHWRDIPLTEDLRNILGRPSYQTTTNTNEIVKGLPEDHDGVIFRDIFDTHGDSFFFPGQQEDWLSDIFYIRNPSQSSDTFSRRPSGLRQGAAVGAGAAALGLDQQEAEAAVPGAHDAVDAVFNYDMNLDQGEVPQPTGFRPLEALRKTAGAVPDVARAGIQALGENVGRLAQNQMNPVQALISGVAEHEGKVIQRDGVGDYVRDLGAEALMGGTARTYADHRRAGPPMSRGPIDAIEQAYPTEGYIPLAERREDFRMPLFEDEDYRFADWGGPDRPIEDRALDAIFAPMEVAGLGGLAKGGARLARGGARYMSRPTQRVADRAASEVLPERLNSAAAIVRRNLDRVAPDTPTPTRNPGVRRVTNTARNQVPMEEFVADTGRQQAFDAAEMRRAAHSGNPDALRRIFRDVTSNDAFGRPPEGSWRTFGEDTRAAIPRLRLPDGVMTKIFGPTRPELRPSGGDMAAAGVLGAGATGAMLSPGRQDRLDASVSEALGTEHGNTLTFGERLTEDTNPVILSMIAGGPGEEAPPQRGQEFDPAMLDIIGAPDRLENTQLPPANYREEDVPALPLSSEAEPSVAALQDLARNRFGVDTGAPGYGPKVQAFIRDQLGRTPPQQLSPQNLSELVRAAITTPRTNPSRSDVIYDMQALLQGSGQEDYALDRYGPDGVLGSETIPRINAFLDSRGSRETIDRDTSQEALQRLWDRYFIR